MAIKEDKKNLNTTDDKGLTKHENQEERTTSVRTFTPNTDIIENKDNLTLIMDMPGVKKDNIKIKLENRELEVEGVIDFTPYENLKPVYSEYQVGNYARRFTVSNVIDTDNIEAALADGVLTLTLPKMPEAQPKQIPIN